MTQISAASCSFPSFFLGLELREKNGEREFKIPTRLFPQNNAPRQNRSLQPEKKFSCRYMWETRWEKREAPSPHCRGFSSSSSSSKTIETPTLVGGRGGGGGCHDMRYSHSSEFIKRSLSLVVHTQLWEQGVTGGGGGGRKSDQIESSSAEKEKKISSYLIWLF